MKKPVLAAAAALMLTSTLAACGNTSTTSPATPTAVQSTTALPQLDVSPDVLAMIDGATVPADAFIETAGVGNMFEIQAGTIASEKSNNPDIRAYGRKMVEDHGQMAIELNSKASIAGNVYTVPVTLDAKHQAMIDQLNAASGDQFDALYVDMMRQSHKDTYELLNAMADRGSLANFNEFAADNKEMVLQHLREADTLATNMMGADMMPEGMDSGSM
jgi:putative membrane protein